MTESLSLIDTIARIDKLSTFSRLMAMSGANEAFGVGGDFTVFAPTNDAFCKVPDRQMNALLQEPGQITLRCMLSYHIVPGRLTAEELGSRASAPTVTDAYVKFTYSCSELKVNHSVVQARNIDAANGIVHELDAVLNYDIETFKTGPLEMPAIEAAASPAELFVPRLSAGKTDAAAGEKITNGTRAARIGRSYRWSRQGSVLF